MRNEYIIPFFFFLCFMSIDAYGQTSASNCDSSEAVEATLTVDGTAHDGSFESAGGLHYFQIDSASDINVNIETTFTGNNLEYSLQLCDSNDNLIASSANNIPARFRPGMSYIVVGSSGADSYQLSVETDNGYNSFLSGCESISTNFPDDPLYGCQWHLKNTGQWVLGGHRITVGEDINVEGVWNNRSGSGINVAVVDGGMDSDHEDLAANVNLNLNHDYSGNNNVFNPSIIAHGTWVAGVIAAAGDNELGVRGVAPQASIYSYNLLSGSNFTSANSADAMTRNRAATAVSNNSWGPENIPVLHSAESTWEMAVETGIREGFGGKGVFYSWAAGNGGLQSDRANFDEYSNYHAVTSVCSTDGFGRKSPFSEEGANLWVCAPGSHIITTDNKDRYNSGLSGTSYSAPIVSGVAALMREVNSNLSWRDLKLILASSARKNDPTDPGWETVALKYGSDSENYDYNPKYGFGVVDAAAAVELAGNWTTVPPMRTLTASANVEKAIPDFNPFGVISTLTISDTDFFTEFVEVELTFSHTYFPDLNIQIISPDGTVSQFTEEYVLAAQRLYLSWVLNIEDFEYTNRTHRFGSAKHLGEGPAGEWILYIADVVSADTGTLHSWSIKVYGHRSDDTMPTFSGEMIADKEYMTETAVTETLPAATSGNGTLTYSLTPALPDGLSFDAATRVISGTPTTVTNKTTYTYTVTDDDGDAAELTFGITVGSDVPTFGSETITDKKYMAGTVITETLPIVLGGDGALTYSLTPALPDGLSFDAATRVISGTPTTVTSKTTYTYTVTDDDGDAAELTFGITVGSDVPTFGSETITDKKYMAGTAITETLPIALGGDGALTYSLTPALPDGLSFNAVTRVISGAPATAMNNTTYTYKVTDADGDTAELSFTTRVVNSTAPGPPTPSPMPDTDAGSGGCTISDQNDVVSDLLGVMACLMLIPVSVVIRRKRRSQIRTY